MHVASSPQWTTSASACTTWTTSARFTDASGPNVNALTAARYINLIRQDGHHSRHKRTRQHPATKSTERNRELTQPARNISNVSPGRSLPVTNRSQAAIEPTANTVRSALATFRLPAVSASRQCPPPYRVRLPAVSAPDRVRIPTVQ